MFKVTDTDLNSIIPDSQKIDPETCILLFKGAGSNTKISKWTIEEFTNN